MCDSKADGGRRCPHSTKIATIRRTAARRFITKNSTGDAPLRSDKIARAKDEAVSQYLYTHPAFAYDCLPNHNSFITPSPRTLPKNRQQRPPLSLNTLIVDPQEEI